MTLFLKVVAPALALAALCAACRPEVKERESGGAPADSAAPASAAAPESAAAPVAGAPSDSAKPAAAPVVIHYEHFRTCSRFMGREGQFFAIRMVSIENRGTAPFAFESERLRFAGGAAPPSPPAFMVPELMNLEAVPGGATQTADELFLLERGAPGPPPRGPVPLGYDAPGVEMARGGAEPAYDTGSGCDEFNT